MLKRRKLFLIFLPQHDVLKSLLVILDLSRRFWCYWRWIGNQNKSFLAGAQVFSFPTFPTRERKASQLYSWGGTSDKNIDSVRFNILNFYRNWCFGWDKTFLRFFAVRCSNLSFICGIAQITSNDFMCVNCIHPLISREGLHWIFSNFAMVLLFGYAEQHSPFCNYCIHAL